MSEVGHRMIRKLFSELQNKMATVRSQISEFDIEQFIHSLQALLINSFHDDLSFDTAEFLFRRLDGYERNIIEEKEIQPYRKIDYRVTN